MMSSLAKFNIQHSKVTCSYDYRCLLQLTALLQVAVQFGNNEMENFGGIQLGK